MELRDLRPYVPRAVLPAAVYVYRRYMEAVCWRIERREGHSHVMRHGFTLPPASLRYRVNGSPNADSFLKIGERCMRDLEAGVERGGEDLSSLSNALDFGCGCGRTLIHFPERHGSSNLYGVDIDSEAISWCRENLEFADFATSAPLPPLKIPPGMFDLVYAISVFTHLKEEYQFRWLDELRRITRPGGLVLLTVHGRSSWKNLHDEQVARIESTGFAFFSANSMSGIFPEWYQNAYHTEEYIRDRYAEYFDVLDYVPQGMNGHQDLVVLKRA